MIKAFYVHDYSEIVALLLFDWLAGFSFLTPVARFTARLVRSKMDD